MDCASLDDSVIHTIIARRGRGSDDVMAILLKNPDYGTGYITRWLKEFDQSLHEDFLGAFHKIVEENA